jgi:hypothetical protein
MADYPKLLVETITFHQGLIRYGNLLASESSQSQEAARLRTELTVQWGRLAEDLSNLGLMRYYQQFGRTSPLFEDALAPVQGWPGPDFGALGLSVQALESMVARFGTEVAVQTSSTHVVLAQVRELPVDPRPQPIKGRQPVVA